jgi:CheY-like chemotaxis protein
MDPEKILKGKRVLIVDDEPDVLELLIELLDMCKVDAASSFEQAKELLENNAYQAAVLDIMGVKGYELLEIANRRDVPALMLTAHAISEDHLRKSIEKGASFYVPKDEMNRIATFLTDMLDAIEKKKNVWARWYERLSGFCDRRFGPKWRDEDPEFWDKVIKY